MKCNLFRIIIFLYIIVSGDLIYAQKIQIVSAENFYGKLAQEIGGNLVEVFNILNNPSIDPHLYSVTTKILIKIYGAQIVIYNGDNYDVWMKKILISMNSKNITIVNVADMVHLPANSNPHIWYRPDVLRTLAINLANLLITRYKLNKLYILANLKHFLTANDLVLLKIKSIKNKYRNISVTATEPVYQYMIDAMGFKNLSTDFQWRIMNDTEPSFTEVLAFNDNIYKHKINILYYNSEVVNSRTKSILNECNANKINVIPITELMPNNLNVNQWLLNELILTENALKKL